MQKMKDYHHLTKVVTFFFCLMALLSPHKITIAWDDGASSTASMKKVFKTVDKLNLSGQQDELRLNHPKIPCQSSSPCVSPPTKQNDHLPNYRFTSELLQQLVAHGLSFVPDRLPVHGTDYETIANNQSHPCNLFYNIKTKRLGPYGTAWLQTIIDLQALENSPIQFMSNQKHGVTPLCPKYDRFSTLQRAEFLLFFGLQLALKESSCKADNGGDGMFGQVAAGLYGWERDQSHIRQARGVAGVTKKNCAGNPLNATNSIRCAVGYFYRILNKGEKITSNNSYFQALRVSPVTAERKKMKEILAQFPGCS